MNFLAPSILLGLLAALGPSLIHLFGKRTVREQPLLRWLCWPAPRGRPHPGDACATQAFCSFEPWSQRRSPFSSPSPFNK